jgi:DNA polymerase-3 subunit delta
MIYKGYLIEQNISNLTKKIILFYGENIGLKDNFKQQLKENNHKSEIIIFNQEELLKNSDIFYNEINNKSLFENLKIYFLNNINDKILELVKEVEAKIDTQKIYLFADVLDKRSKLRNYLEKSENGGVVACYPDNEVSIKKIIQKKLIGFSGLTTQNINMIVDNSNLDRIKLNNELNKITTYFDNKIINNQKLEILLDIKINDNFNTLKDEALMGNKLKTNKLLSDTIIETEKNIFYLSLINQRLNKLSEVSMVEQNSNLDDTVNGMKPPIFWKDKPNFIIQAKKWNSKKIKSILNKTYKLEIEFKSNAVVNKNILMKKLLVDICELANVS